MQKKVKNGRRVKCLHRYLGLNQIYTPRFRVTREGIMLTEYLCQIKGCNHWQIHFKNKMSKKELSDWNKNRYGKK